jgi:hypothetical protein
MDSPTFVAIHVAISIIAIVSGFVVLRGLFVSRASDVLILPYLVSSIATCLTGYGFHRTEVLPSHVVGGITLVILLLTALARYGFGFRSCWRIVFAVGVVMSLWLNVFVLIAQGFLKVPALHVLAPKGSEPAFLIVQAFALCVFVVFGVKATRNFRPSEIQPFSQV